MRLAEWRFSARLAWQDAFIRWTTVATVVLVVGMSSFMLWKLLPEGWRAGVITMHYNVYLGIDEVRPWAWVFLFPSFAVGVTLVDVLVSYGIFRKDALASRMLIATCFVAMVMWAVGSFFLIRVNL